MTFINTGLLFGLALMSIPIIIHLLNRRRHRTMHWGAMMFLLNATRQSKGHARLKHILILTFRMLAIGALIFAIARPLAGSWLGWLGSTAPDTIIVILDRSASMDEKDLQTGQSKRSVAINKISEVLGTYDSSPRIVLIESTGGAPQLLPEAGSLKEVPANSGTDTRADIPGMMQAALDYIVANKAGKTEIWIASDLQQSNWDPDGNRWEAIKAGFSNLKQEVSFQTLTFSDMAEDNISVVVTNSRRVKTANGSELVISVTLKRIGTAERIFPITFNLGGQNPVSEEITMTGQEFTLSDHRIPLGEEGDAGWGWVALPPDSNERDNRYYFSYSEQVPLKSVIVAEGGKTADRLKLVAAPPLPGATEECELVDPAAATQIPFGETGLIIWQAPMPRDSVARQLEQFVTTGGTLLMFPPGEEQDDQGEFLGISWQPFEDTNGAENVTAPAPEDDDRREFFKIGSFRADDGPLRRSAAGRVLPLTALKTFKRRPINYQGVAVATYDGGRPFLISMNHGTGVVLACATLPDPEFSNLARNGIVLYAMTRRALESGSTRLGNALTITTGESPNINPNASWKYLSRSNGDAVDAYVDHMTSAGVFEVDGKFIAQNRPLEEDDPTPIDAALLDSKLFKGLKHRNVEQQVDDDSSLLSEIWKFFIVAMIAFLLGEALLCLPEPLREEVTV